MEDNSMEQMISRNEVDEIMEWKASLKTEKQDMESDEESETLFIVEEIEAI